MSAKMREDARDLLEREALERGKLSEGKREGVRELFRLHGSIL